MKEKGQKNVTVGFQNVSDGWHRVCVQEGIALRVNEDSGKESLGIPFMVDEEGEDAGGKITYFINTRDENRVPYKNVEKNIANLIANLGMDEAFEKKFPGEVSFLDAPVIETMKIRLPGKFCQIQVKSSKDNKDQMRARIVSLYGDGEKVPDDKGKKGTGKAAPVQGALKTKEGEDW